VNTVHEGRIMHGDLKPANFMLVKGVLTLIDFGIAKSIQSDTTNIERESQVGTLNYMSPEAFLMNEKDENGNVIKCGRSSDIWALGCILYQMVYGKTPFAHITSLHAKIQEVANPRHKINYLPLSNPHLLDIMKRCLAYNRDERSRIPELLKHPFLQPERDVGGKVEAEIVEEIRAEEARGRDTAALRRVLRRVKMLSL
jgi:serine/threonine-protein kinase TTK/MPS1